ncbi:MAG: LLM class flavin-dependent oxidoreductase [Gammaproteobacteria bacterium]|jgi:alkanesulfonate monooxygenase SsuD/methylene tetrahydromethanopterin reductase-like flavin-dependent oxidoreductase (luciferase family)|nr:LLM class flavin-dependent oxidoreductase [Gammaproteobacteria bacterium]MBT5603068.1 LLM class flavin-dependent oxidoreductase [Gammaproteobacteria bacterium]MBT6246896.1 LLM class flavin-dependent oxidoreductase [Gammaproteobacteria bacterium]
MKFGIFYEHQLPKPWDEGVEQKLFQDALDQVELADRIGIDYAWEVEHHFLEEYSHSSAPEIFLAAASQRTKRIRLGHGIRQVISAYNHPARTAECIATLDLVSNGRVEFGTGESSAILELGGFGIAVGSKREQYLEATEQICNMLAMDPYPGFEGKYFSMPCRNIVPKPVQKPHPPLWVACSNRETIKMAARLGIGALTFAFVDPLEARHWVDEYYSIIKSDECVPIGHHVNANICMVTSFSLHEDRQVAIDRGLEGFEFFGYALGSLYGFGEHRPGRMNLFEEFRQIHQKRLADSPLDITQALAAERGGIGTPEDMRNHLRKFEDVGVDQVTFIQQAGLNKHEHICESLELFAAEVMPEFKARQEEQQLRKEAELKPYIEAAMQRKEFMKMPADQDLPVFPALGRSVVAGDADPNKAAG